MSDFDVRGVLGNAAGDVEEMESERMRRDGEEEEEEEEEEDGRGVAQRREEEEDEEEDNTSGGGGAGRRDDEEDDDDDDDEDDDEEEEPGRKGRKRTKVRLWTLSLLLSNLSHVVPAPSPTGCRESLHRCRGRGR